MGSSQSCDKKEEEIEEYIKKVRESGKFSNGADLTKFAQTYMDQQTVNKNNIVNFMTKWTNGYLRDFNKESAELALPCNINLMDASMYVLKDKNTSCFGKKIEVLVCMVKDLSGKQTQFAYVTVNNKLFYSVVGTTLALQKTNPEVPPSAAPQTKENKIQQLLKDG